MLIEVPMHDDPYPAWLWAHFALTAAEVDAMTPAELDAQRQREQVIDRGDDNGGSTRG